METFSQIVYNVQNTSYPWPCAVSTVTTSTSTSTNAETRIQHVGFVRSTHQESTMAVFTGIGVVFDFHDVFVGYEAYLIYNCCLLTWQLFYFKLLGFLLPASSVVPLGAVDQFFHVS